MSGGEEEEEEEREEPPGAAATLPHLGHVSASSPAGAMRDPTARPLWLAQRRLAVAQALGGESAAAAAGRPQPCPRLAQRLDKPVG